MRTILFSLLLASVAATPALAERPGDHDRGRFAAERSDAPRAEAPRQDRAERPSFDRSEARQQPRYEAREERAPRTMTADPGWQRRSADDSALRAGRDPRPMLDRGGVQENIDQVRERFEQRQHAIQNSQDNRQLSSRNDPRWYGDISHPQLVRRDGDRHRPVRWNPDWRDDHRYDWRDARRHYGSRFHLGVYIDPFNWGYQRFPVGYRLYPNYYSSRYWINDPGMYRLPFPPPGTQWIRYYNDALLVDMYTGQVVDVIPDFFW